MEGEDAHPLTQHLVYHLKLCDRPLQFDPQRGKMFWDQTNKQLIIINENELVRMSFPKGDRPPMVRLGIQNRNKPIHKVTFSPSCTRLAIQRSHVEIEFTDVVKMSTFVRTCKRTRDTRILGFHWTFDDNVFMVTTRSVELYKFTRGTIKLLKSYSISALWFVYNSRTKLLTVATGKHGNTLQTFCFKSDAAFRLPKFDIPHEVDTKGPPLKAANIILTQLYTQVYCLYVPNPGRRIVLYNMTKDNVSPVLVLDLQVKTHIAVNVVDNLIVVHNLDSQVAMLFDVKDPDPSFPICGALQIAPFALPNGSTITAKPHWCYLVPNVVWDSKAAFIWQLQLSLDGIAKSFASDCVRLVTFLIRRARSKPLILSTIRNALCQSSPLAVVGQLFDIINTVLASVPSDKLRMGLSLSSSRTSFTSSSPPPSSPSSSSSLSSSSPLSPSSAPAASLHAMSSSTGSASMAALSGPQVSTGVHGSVSSSAASLTSPDSSASSPPPTRLVSHRTAKCEMIVTQSDMYKHVFYPLVEENVLPFRYAIAVLMEYIRSLSYLRMESQPHIYELVIDLLVRHQRFYQLHQFLQYHVVTDSQHVALKLLAIGKNPDEDGNYSPAYQLALDMLQRLYSPDHIVDILVSKGDVLSALRLIRTHNIMKPDLNSILQVASTMDDMTFYTTMQFFHERGVSIPVQYRKAYLLKFPPSTTALPSSPV